MRFYRVLLPLLISVSVAAAEVRLSPEERLAPVALEQLYVQAVRRSGHVFAAWSNRLGNVIEVSFDGVVLPEPRVISPQPVIVPIVAAGSHTFLLAWTKGEDSSFVVRACRVSTDGVNLDPIPIELCRGPRSTPGLLFDGDAYIVACTERGSPDRTRILRIPESGSVIDQMSRIVQPDVRPLFGNGQLVLAGATYSDPSPIPEYHYADIGIYGLNDPSFDLIRAYGKAWAAAAGPDRIVIAMSADFSEHLTFVQASFAGKLLRASYVPSQLGSVLSRYAALVWNGGEYVLVWTEDRVRGIRLDRNGDPIDAVPFDISGPGVRRTTPSLSVTDNGVLIVYGYEYYRPGYEVHAYMRTLERLPSVPRRTSVRH